ncbi:siderophore-interacting protein [Virgisporangium aliadipatigenens]|nr:siderophore-interacting protein [Virgisporangium aliadipatigenens]
MSKLLDVVDRFLVRATVADVSPVTPRMRRVSLAGEAVRGLDWMPGQHVRVRVEGMSLRTYSVWQVDGDRLDLGVLDHPEDGPGARWAREARVGQPVAFMKPEGRMVPRDGAAYHLFVGDETACPAFGAMLAALPAASRVHGVIEVAAPSDRMSFGERDLEWVCPKGTDALVAALRALDLPDEPGVAYIAGEARTCQAVRRHLQGERGWPRSALVSKPFWTPGRRGMD